MEHVGSKYLMECPVYWANRLLQIEWSSRRLNRATWNISSCSFSQLEKRGWKKQVSFIHVTC